MATILDSASPERWVDCVFYTAPINTRRSFWKVWSGHELEKMLLVSENLERRGSMLSRQSLRASENVRHLLDRDRDLSGHLTTVGESREGGPRVKVFIQN